MILSQPDQSSIIWLKGGYGGFPSVPQRSEHGEVQGPIPGHIKLSVVTLDVLGPSAIQPCSQGIIWIRAGRCDTELMGNP